jgi:hypothetical protein
MWKSGGVYVHVRCTCCGELCTIMTEFEDGRDGDTMTGFKINHIPVGGPKGKPILLLTLSDLRDADEHTNASGESGGQLLMWFTNHAMSKKHRHYYVHHAAHFDIHLCGLTHGGSPRFYARSAMPGHPVAMGKILLPRSGLQGGTYPSKESVIRAIGHLVDLVGATLFMIGNHRLDVSFTVDSEGKRYKAK